MVALCGPNGAGKSTLLRALAGVLPGGPAADPRRVAYLPQGARCAWGLTVAEVAALGRIPHRDAAIAPVERALCGVRPGGAARSAGGPDLGRAGAAGDARARLRDRTGGVPAGRADRRPRSGRRLRTRSWRCSAATARREAGTVVVVLHALDLALRYADRVVVLRDGRIVADLPAREALPAAAVGLRAALRTGSRGRGSCRPGDAPRRPTFRRPARAGRGAAGRGELRLPRPASAPADDGGDRGDDPQRAGRRRRAHREPRGPGFRALRASSRRASARPGAPRGRTRAVSPATPRPTTAAIRGAGGQSGGAASAARARRGSGAEAAATRCVTGQPPRPARDAIGSCGRAGPGSPLGRRRRGGPDQRHLRRHPGESGPERAQPAAALSRGGGAPGPAGRGDPERDDRLGRPRPVRSWSPSPPATCCSTGRRSRPSRGGASSRNSARTARRFHPACRSGYASCSIEGERHGADRQGGDARRRRRRDLARQRRAGAQGRRAGGGDRRGGRGQRRDRRAARPCAGPGRYRRDAGAHPERSVRPRRRSLRAGRGRRPLASRRRAVPAARAGDRGDERRASPR